MPHQFNTPKTTGLLLLAILAIYMVAAWLDDISDHGKHVEARGKVVDLAGTMCGNADWKISGTDKEPVITCIYRKPLYIGRARQ